MCTGRWSRGCRDAMSCIRLPRRRSGPHDTIASFSAAGSTMKSMALQATPEPYHVGTTLP
eukprot:9334486-Lingulodinium_polyedra.AAC.1